MYVKYVLKYQLVLALFKYKNNISAYNVGKPSDLRKASKTHGNTHWRWPL